MGHDSVGWINDVPLIEKDNAYTEVEFSVYCVVVSTVGEKKTRPYMYDSVSELVCPES